MNEAEKREIAERLLAAWNRDLQAAWRARDDYRAALRQVLEATGLDVGEDPLAVLPAALEHIEEMRRAASAPARKPAADDPTEGGKYRWPLKAGEVRPKGYQRRLLGQREWHDGVAAGKPIRPSSLVVYEYRAPVEAAAEEG